MVTDIERDKAFIDWWKYWYDQDVCMGSQVDAYEAWKESAKQALKEAADSAVRYCKEVFGIEGLNTLRAAILTPLQNVGNSEQIPTERNKLEIAVKALEYYANYSGCEASGLDMRDMAERALKEIQG